MVTHKDPSPEVPGERSATDVGAAGAIDRLAAALDRLSAAILTAAVTTSGAPGGVTYDIFRQHLEGTLRGNKPDADIFKILARWAEQAPERRE